MLTLAHVSDPHLPPLPRVAWRQIANKRLLGYLSWHRRRKHEHRAEVLDALLRDLETVAPDQICVTGDLTNIGLPEEYAAAATWLARLGRICGRTGDVSVVPGNHDAYVAAPHAETAARWAPWMSGDDGAAGFPYLRRRGPVSLIGVSTAVPTPPFLASGRVGAAQAARLAEMLDAEGRAGQARVVLIHHPPQAGATRWRKSLHDAARVRDALMTGGAEIVLHGHLHRPLIARLPVAGGRMVPVYGAGSASLCGGHGGPPAQYHLVTIGQAPEGGFEVAVRGRSYDPSTGRFGFTIP
jgi:3',5'-cyclic AMP phosphodiesterase CpdA